LPGYWLAQYAGAFTGAACIFGVYYGTCTSDYIQALSYYLWLLVSVWLAQLGKAVAAPTHARLCVQAAGGPGSGPCSIPGADKLDSGFHPR